MLVERLGRDPTAAGNRIRGGGHIQRGAEVEDRDVLPGLQLALEVLRGDPGGPEPPENGLSSRSIGQRTPTLAYRVYEVPPVADATTAPAGSRNVPTEATPLSKDPLPAATADNSTALVLVLPNTT